MRRYNVWSTHYSCMELYLYVYGWDGTMATVQAIYANKKGEFLYPYNVCFVHMQSLCIPTAPSKVTMTNTESQRRWKENQYQISISQIKIHIHFYKFLK